MALLLGLRGVDDGLHGVAALAATVVQAALDAVLIPLVVFVPVERRASDCAACAPDLLDPPT